MNFKTVILQDGDRSYSLSNVPCRFRVDGFFSVSGDKPVEVLRDGRRIGLLQQIAWEPGRTLITYLPDRCGCQCHIRGIVGFFHCFDVCCSEPDAVLYESEAEHLSAHPQPQITREQAYELAVKRAAAE